MGEKRGVGLCEVLLVRVYSSVSVVVVVVHNFGTSTSSRCLDSRTGVSAMEAALARSALQHEEIIDGSGLCGLGSGGQLRNTCVRCLVRNDGDRSLHNVHDLWCLCDKLVRRALRSC